MKQIDFIEFEQLMNPIKQYDDEITSINTALKPFIDGGHLEIGYFLMDAYIDLLAKTLDVDVEHLCWFVFDNEWGINQKKLFKKRVKNLSDFYHELKNI